MYDYYIYIYILILYFNCNIVVKLSLLFKGHFHGAAEESKAYPCLPRNVLLKCQYETVVSLLSSCV